MIEVEDKIFKQLSPQEILDQQLATGDVRLSTLAQALNTDQTEAIKFIYPRVLSKLKQVDFETSDHCQAITEPYVCQPQLDGTVSHSNESSLIKDIELSDLALLVFLNQMTSYTRKQFDGTYVNSLKMTAWYNFLNQYFNQEDLARIEAMANASCQRRDCLESLKSVEQKYYAEGGNIYNLEALVQAEAYKALFDCSTLNQIRKKLGIDDKKEVIINYLNSDYLSAIGKIFEELKAYIDRQSYISPHQVVAIAQNLAQQVREGLEENNQHKFSQIDSYLLLKQEYDDLNSTINWLTA